jgi:hypothetical protein
MKTNEKENHHADGKVIFFFNEVKIRKGEKSNKNFKRSLLMNLFFILRFNYCNFFKRS